MTEKDSILDRVISSQKSSQIKAFQPNEILNSLFKNLTEKEVETLKRRFGLMGHSPETLGRIGADFKVTRERVRQIEAQAIKKLKNLKNLQEKIEPIRVVVTDLLREYGGILEEKSFFKKILELTNLTSSAEPSLVFILKTLLTDVVDYVKPSSKFRAAWRTKDFDEALWYQVTQTAKEIFEKENSPLTLDQLMEKLQKHPSLQNVLSRINKKIVEAYIEVCAFLGKNPFKEYGLIKWGSIKPRRMNDKILLVLKKAKRPLHFTEIARRINELKFDNRIAHPPTVHNELILSKDYVLVGRGLYALKEWGFKRGVVADIIEDILKKEGPLKRDEIIEKVLKQRFVKRNTIILALTNKERFKKLPSGEYTLARS